MPANNPPATANALAYLTRALALLEKPRWAKCTPDEVRAGTLPMMIAEHSWITGAEAISIEGVYCEPEDERAQAWCTIGVVKAVTHYDPEPVKAYTYCLSILNLANPAYVATGSKNAQPYLNDTAESFETVRRFFQRGIAYLEKHSS